MCCPSDAPDRFRLNSRHVLDLHVSVVQRFVKLQAPSCQIWESPELLPNSPALQGCTNSQKYNGGQSITQCRHSGSEGPRLKSQQLCQMSVATN